MTKPRANEAVISGIGVLTSIGLGKEAFQAALIAGSQSFAVMRRPGRQHNSNFLGAELSDIPLGDGYSRRDLQNTSLSAKAALAAVSEAWADARLGDVEPSRIGLIVGGSNLQRREVVNLQGAMGGQMQNIRPSHAFTFLDSDVCGVCTQHFGIRGPAYTVGGASASGLLAAIQATQLVLAGHADVVIAVGALMDLSYLELEALRSLGAMGSTRFQDYPNEACRPFDRDRDGFIFGEGCAAVAIECARVNDAPRHVPYAAIAGWSVVSDANRYPNSSTAGISAAIQRSLQHANLTAHDVDYINPHGTGSVLGDEAEIAAIVNMGLSKSFINATKSLTGHSMSAAGLVEVVATIIQMHAGFIHPTRNLVHPIDSQCRWVGECAVQHRISTALCLSVGFGGINCGLLLRHFQQ